MPSLFEYEDSGTVAAARSGGNLKGGKNRVRACDPCRRKKVRCDGAEAVPHVGDPCSNCIAYGYECTYVAASENRFKDVEYMKRIERELAEANEKLRKYETRTTVDAPDSQSASPFASSSSEAHGEQSSPSNPDFASNDSDDEDEHEALAEGFKCLNMNEKHAHFLGKSSGLVFVHAATMALQHEFSKDDSDQALPKHPGKAIEQQTNARIAARQRECWDSMTELLLSDPPHPPEVFPPSELMATLIDDYFTHLNCALPLLHRPTFEDSIRAGLHLTDEAFGSTVLLVCAVGARFSKDPAVLPERTKSWYWAGWDWFQRVRASRKLVHLAPASYRDLQIFCLMAMYIADSPMSFAVYVIVGHGIRVAQDMGVHRRATYSSTPNIEDELKKRAFWCLVMIDRGMCYKLGRPYTNYEEEFDVELPLECDEEYWKNDDPNLALKQPEGKPARMALFNCMLRLGRIHAQMLRTLYTSRFSARRRNPEWAQKVVSELDSALNEFMDTVPEHLKWNPDVAEPLFLRQSATLYAFYYTIQICIHRGFIPFPGKPSPLSFPSMAICTNAARSCIHILDAQYVRLGAALLNGLHQMALSSSTTILLLSVWNQTRENPSADCRRDFDCIRRALRLLKVLEGRWSMAARLWDLFNDLVHLIQRSRNSNNDGTRPTKRQRDDSDDANGGDEQPTHNAPFPSTGATSSQVPPQSAAQPVPASTNTSPMLGSGSSFPQAAFDFSLPVYSAELGGLPVWPDTASTLAASNDFWQSFGIDPAFNPSLSPPPSASYSPPFYASSGVDGTRSQFGADPDLETIFASIVPQGPYSDLSSLLRQGPGAPYSGEQMAFNADDAFGCFGVSAPSSMQAQSGNYDLPQDSSRFSTPQSADSYMWTV